MRSRKHRNIRKKMRKTRKGGFFLNSRNKSVVPLAECDPNNLSSIKGSNDLHANYQKCCPKGMFGRKNSSPYCKQLDLNFQSALKEENDANEYQGYEPDEVYKMKQDELAAVPKKPWYKLRGGKTKRNKKHSHRKK
jgi:hypothetical protein